MDEVVLVRDWPIAFGAGFGAGLAGGEVRGEGVDGDVEFAVLAKLGLVLASFFVLFVVGLGEVLGAVGAFLFSVKLLLVLLLEVDVEHLAAGLAFLDVAAAVAEVRGYLGLGEIFEAVVASLYGLVLHLEIF